MQRKFPGIDATETLSDQGYGCRVLVGEFLDGATNLDDHVIQLLAPACLLWTKIAAEAPALSFKTVAIQVAIESQERVARCQEAGKCNHGPITTAVRCNFIPEAAAEHAGCQLPSRTEQVHLKLE